MVPDCAVPGCGGIIVCNSCSHHCSTWISWEGADPAQKRRLGTGWVHAKFGSSSSSRSCRPGQHIRVMVRGNELVAKCEYASTEDPRVDFTSFLLPPLPCSAQPFGSGLAVIQPVPSFIRAEPQIALASQGVGELVITPVSLCEHIFFPRSHQVSPMASGEHPELMEQWTGTSLLYLPELETATSKTERKISSPLAHEALLKARDRKHYLLDTDQYLYCSGSGGSHWHPAPVILGTATRLKTDLASKPLQLNSPMWINQTCPTNRPAAKGLALPL